MVFGVLSVLVTFVLLSGLRIAKEYQRGVLFRLGRYVGLRGPGLFWIIPLGIERVVIVDIRTQTVTAEQQETITRDSVTVKVNAVLWFHVVDAARSVIAVMDSTTAVYQLALTGLRNIIGQHDLDREKRARIIKAEAELEASVKLAQASAQMAGDPAALELRRMQMIAEVGAENNSTTVLMIPSDFVTLAQSLSEYMGARKPVSA